MAREKPLDPDMSRTVPVWFLTYSDVITLLMTFFILLLTFATDEPEKFERMQISLFGGGGATGIAGPAQGPLDQDAVAERYRPHAGRVTTRGAEMPPSESDPTVKSLASGLSGLDSEPTHDPLRAYEVQLPYAELVNNSGQVTAVAKQRLRMLAQQLNSGSFSVTFRAAQDSQIEGALALARFLIDEQAVLPGKIGIGMHSMPDVKSTDLGLIINRQFSDKQ